MSLNSYNNPRISLQFGKTIAIYFVALVMLLCIFSFAIAAEEEGVCARVRIRLTQDAVIARNAFKATLEITNAPENVTLGNITVTLNITDGNNQTANNLFGIHLPELSGISDINGGGVIEPGNTAIATWLLSATRDAAPDVPVTYYVGGEFSYKQGDSTITMPLFPAPILVKPDPLLVLDYFWVRNVYSNDPFTPEIEPAEPFPLGLMVQNNGKGVANNFRITSSQPEIIENEKGLLIDFKIIGTQVNSEPVSPSLTVNLGNIDPGTTSVAKWLMTSSLQGKFIEYTATFEHIDGLGIPRLSLIDTVNIHELNHAVRVDIPADDNKPDFLVNDVPDDDFMPDTLYNSEGPTEVVNIGLNPSISSQIVDGHLEAQLSVTVPTGWVYIRTEDPGQDQFRLKQVIRSDGREIRLDDNTWTTHRTIRLVGQAPYREHLLHLFDKDSTGSYTLVYEVSGTDTDADKDGYISAAFGGDDCDDSNPNIHPGALETCDGKDNNCDGQVDEGFDVGAPCSVGVGACKAEGVKVCSPDKLSTVCNAVAGAPTVELCGDGIDNNCDGQVDEGFDVGAPCSVGVGACKADGFKVCPADKLSTVCDAVEGTPTAEICGDGIDNNCDGQADEGCQCSGNTDCFTSFYCQKSIGDCQGTGFCIIKPLSCSSLDEPVCGCNGSTYTNIECTALSGVSVDYTGKCNNAPVANAGTDQNVITGNLVTLDGSNSFDSDGDMITFLWTFVEVPAGSAVTDASLSDANSAQPKFIPDIDGSYLLSLIVNDGLKDSTPDEVTITAKTPNVAPNAKAGSDQNVLAGNIVYLDGTGSSDPDKGPLPLSYLWSFFTIPSNSLLSDNDIRSGEQANASFTTDVAGTYEVKLTVSDGDLSSEDTVQIIATSPNVPPNANAGADMTIYLSNTAVLDGSSSNDPDGEPQALTYSWSFVSVPKGSRLKNTSIIGRDTASASFVPDVTGTYVLELMVSDGEDSAYDNVAITVIPVPQVPDLSSTWSNVSNTGPSKKTGYKVSGSLTISNTGNGTANGVVVNVYISNDTNPDSGDVLIKTLKYSSIRAGTSKSSTISYTTSTNPGSKYLISVIDPDNTVPESNEENNISSGVIP